MRRKKHILPRVTSAIY